MLDATVVERSYKIGKNWLFDKNTAIGYKVIRKNGVLKEFIEAYRLEMDAKNCYAAKTSENVPIGIIRKSIEIMEKE